MYGDHVQSFVWRWAKEWQKEEDWTLMSVVGNAMNHVYCLKNEWNADTLQLVRWFMHKKSHFSIRTFVYGAPPCFPPTIPTSFAEWGIVLSLSPSSLSPRNTSKCYSISSPLVALLPKPVPLDTVSTSVPSSPLCSLPTPATNPSFLTTGPHTFMATVGRRFFFISWEYICLQGKFWT